MVSGEFDQALRALCEAKPFRAFAIEFNDGRRLEVDFPVAYRDGAAVYLDPKGRPTIFRYDEVERIVIASPVTADAQ